MEPAKSATATRPATPMVTLRAFIILAIIVALFIVVAQWFTRPSQEQLRHRPEFNILTGPASVTGKLFGVAFGSHKIHNDVLRRDAEALHGEVFFIRNRQGSIFETDLPDTIGAGFMPGDHGIAYSITRSIPTKKAFYKRLASFFGGPTLYLDNATDSTVQITIDSTSLPDLPAKSYAELVLSDGIYQLTVRNSTDSSDIDTCTLFVTDYDRERSGFPVKFYVYNVQNGNSYGFNNATYRKNQSR
ncbi:MAG: hypothetical protein NTU53_06865 [Planctomycetota bacterium]|nr:hypothetical protein [Planctomycetota bacterium]